MELCIKCCNLLFFYFLMVVCKYIGKSYTLLLQHETNGCSKISSILKSETIIVFTKYYV